MRSRVPGLFYRFWFGALVASFALTQAGCSRPVFAVGVAEDGSVELQGDIFSDPDMLRPKLEELHTGLWTPAFILWASDTVPPEQVENAIALVEEAGGSVQGSIMKVGFITQPQGTPQTGSEGGN